MDKRVALLFAGCLLALVGCDSGSTSETPSAPTPTPTPDPQFVACMSLAPVDSGNPDEPVITLRGPRAVNQQLGTPYADPGATALDPHEGDITSRIAVTGLDGVNTSAVGDYLIRYNVTNSAQLAAVETVRVVRVSSGTFPPQTPRDIGSTSAHWGYYEHLPVNYGDAATGSFPLIVFLHGWGPGRFDDYGVFKAPLSQLTEGDMVKLLQDGPWDNSRPFIVLSPQRCVNEEPDNAQRTKIFIDYAINAYKVDPARIYLAGYSAGSGYTWDYVAHYPHQLAAVVPMSGSWDGTYTTAGCVLADTPAWAFQAADDPVGPYQHQVDTVALINSCKPKERAKITIFPSGGHNQPEEFLTIALTGLGLGLPAYDIYDQSIYDWLLQHSRQASQVVSAPNTRERVAMETSISGLALSVTPETIAFGASATLQWTLDGAGSCTASGDWLGPRPVSGGESIQPVARGSYGYILTCYGARGAIARSVSLRVR